MRRNLLTPLSLAMLAIVAGCATTPTMGPTPDVVPPQLVVTDQKDPSTGRALLDWDREQGTAIEGGGYFSAAKGNSKVIAKV